MPDNTIYYMRSLVEGDMGGDHNWQQGRLAAQFCEGCGSPNPQLYPKPIIALVDSVASTPYSYSAPYIRLVRHELLNILLDYEPSIVPGTVLLRNGSIVSSFVSLHFPPQLWIAIRGTASPRRHGLDYQRCIICDRRSSVPAAIVDGRHVLRQHLAPGNVWVTSNFFLFVSEKVRNDARMMLFPSLVFEPVNVLDARVTHIPTLDDA